MTYWKAGAVAMALASATGVAAAVAPLAHEQTAAVITPGRAELFNAGGSSRLGVSVRDVSAADVKDGQPAGVLIADVAEGGAAATAGLRSGDVVVEFDGERVRSVRQFTRLVQESVAGRPVALAVLRNGQRQSMTVTPEEAGNTIWRLGEDMYGLSESLRGLRVAPPRPPAPPAPPRWEFPDLETFVWRGPSSLGMTITDLAPQLAEYFGTKEGVLVSSVAENTPAAQAGVKAGDIVTGVNGRTVTRPAELRREVQRLQPGESFTLTVVRDRKALTLKGRTDERPRSTIRTSV